MRKCFVRGCKEPVRSNGLCQKHYARMLRHGDPSIVLKSNNVTHPQGGVGCSVKGCDGDFHCHGYCYKHYVRWKRHGDPLYNKYEQIKRFLEQAAICKSDGCLIWPWSRAGKGYSGHVRINGEPHYAHRLVCELVHGAPPTLEHHAAHVCGKGHLGCVNGRHLVWATPSENEQHKRLHGTYRGQR